MAFEYKSGRGGKGGKVGGGGKSSGSGVPGKRTRAGRRYARVDSPPPGVQRKPLIGLSDEPPLDLEALAYPFEPDLAPHAPIMRKATAAQVAPGASAALNAAQGSLGQPLPADLRGDLEHQLGHDLAGVRIHTGGDSETAAGAIAAKAFTQGNDIHFAPGQYDPASKEGQRLLAHEVAHTVQQRGVARPIRQRSVNDAAELPAALLQVSQPADALEHQADAFADAFVARAGQRVAVSPGSAPAGVVARKADDDFESHPEEQPSGKSASDLHGSHSGAGTARHQTRMLTDEDVNGDADKRQSEAKRRLARQQADYRRITKRSLKRRFRNAMQEYKDKVQLEPDPSLDDLFRFGVGRRFFHPWEAGTVAHMYGVKEKAQRRFADRQKKYAADKRRAAFVRRAKHRKTAVSRNIITSLIAPTLTGLVGAAEMANACSKKGTAKDCMGAALTMRLRTGNVGRNIVHGATRTRTQPPTTSARRLRNLRSASKRRRRGSNRQRRRIARKQFQAARNEFIAAWKQHASAAHANPAGMAFDPKVYRSLVNMATASARQGMLTADAFVAKINKILANAGEKPLTKHQTKRSRQAFWQAKRRSKKNYKVQPGKKGKWSKLLNNPKPNANYNVNGYIYTTDAKGRVVKIRASKLRLKKRARNDYRQKRAGGKDRRKGDQGGHGIAAMFDGPGEAINLFAQAKKVNLSDWSKLEGIWKDALLEGKKVSVTIRAHYPKGPKTNLRPKGFEIEYTIGKQRPKRVEIDN